MVEKILKVGVYDTTGNQQGDIKLPDFFGFEYRPNIILKVWNILRYNHKHPQAVYALAGKEVSASGKQSHRRHRYKSLYGRGVSRIPRKVMLRRGEQFNWTGAFVPGTRGGFRAHPHKITSIKKINKKELRMAFLSALSSTANKQLIIQRYERLNDKDLGNFNKITFPIITETINFNNIKEFKQFVQKVLDKASVIAFPLKKIRAGKGKMRSRKYKKSSRLLFVISEPEIEQSKRLRNTGIDIVPVSQLGIFHLALGGVAGRLTIFTKKALDELSEKLKKINKQKRKTGKIKKTSKVHEAKKEKEKGKNKKLK